MEENEEGRCLGFIEAKLYGKDQPLIYIKTVTTIEDHPNTKN